MDEDSYNIEEEFLLRDCDRNEHLKHIRQLEEERNAQEQKEIELERVQRQIINKLNITEKSDNEVKCSDNGKMQSVDKSNCKQNGIHKSSKTEVDNPYKTVQKSSERRKTQPNKPAPSFHSDASSSHNHNPYYKGNSYRREGFHDVRQQRSRRGSRGRSSNYQRYQERYYNRPVNNSQQEFDHTGKQQVDHVKEQTKEYFEVDLPPELFPTNIDEEEEMLQEAIELSKQQMFIDKLERREIDKTIEETIRSQQIEQSNEGRKTQKQCNDRMVSRERKDASRTSFPNSDHSVVTDGMYGANYSKQEKANHLRKNFAKPAKPWLSDKQNGTTNRDSFQTRGTKSRNPCQMPKTSNMYKQNPSNQTETAVCRTDLTSETLAHSSLDNIAEYDINSSKWKEYARKDLKQLLHLDNSPDSSVRTNHLEIATKVAETSAVHGAEANRRDTYVNETPYKENYDAEMLPAMHTAKNGCNNSHMGSRNNCVVSAKFSDYSQNYGSSHKTGSRSRMSERRTTRVLHKSKPNTNNSSNDSESACANWIPYRKLVEEGRTESIPPRFRKQYQHIIS